jgi:hypothetical protein
MYLNRCFYLLAFFVFCAAGIVKGQNQQIMSFELYVPFEDEWIKKISNADPQVGIDLSDSFKSMRSCFTCEEWSLGFIDKINTWYTEQERIALFENTDSLNMLVLRKCKQNKARIERVLRNRIQLAHTKILDFTWTKANVLFISVESSLPEYELIQLLTRPMQLSFWKVHKYGFLIDNLNANAVDACWEGIRFLEETLAQPSARNEDKEFIQPYLGFAASHDTAKLSSVFQLAQQTDCFSSPAVWVWSCEPLEKTDLFVLYALKPSKNGKPAMSGDFIQSAKVQKASYAENKYEVYLEMKASAHASWAQLTALCAATQDFIAVVIDAQAFNVPRVMSKIEKGRSVISGNFSQTEAETIARNLQSGSLPFSLQLVPK